MVEILEAEMKPKYKRLYDNDGHWIGISRDLTEYLPLTSGKWTLEPIKCDPDRTEKIAVPPMGMASRPRQAIRE